MKSISIFVAVIIAVLGNPVDCLNVFVKLHRPGYSCLFQSYLDDLLFLGREDNITPPTLEILIAPKVAYEQCHKLVILVGIHTVLEINESPGKPYRLVAHIVRTVCLLAALGGIDEFQKRAQLRMPAICQLPQTAVSHRAVCMEA